MQTRKVVTMLAGVAALSGTAHAGEVMGVVAPVSAPSTGAVFTAKGKETVSVRFNGRMHFQYDSLSNDEGAVETSNRFYFRRLRLGAKAKLSNGFTAETVYDFSGNSVSIDKAVLSKKFDILEGATVSLGFTKVPFGFEESSSSNSIPTIERSAANRIFADDADFSGRHTGIHTTLNIGGGFSVAGALVNAEQGESSRTNDELGYFGRVQWSNDFLTIGADAGITKDDVGAQDREAYTAYINYNQGGLDVLAEMFDGNPTGAATNGGVEGFAVRVSYKFDKFEPVLRYSQVETDDAAGIDFDELIRRSNDTGAAASELESIYAGVNYHYSKSVKFMLGYEMATAEDNAGNEVEDVSGVRARVNLVF